MKTSKLYSLAIPLWGCFVAYIFALVILFFFKPAECDSKIILEMTVLAITFISVLLAFDLLKETIETRKDSLKPVLSFRFRHGTINASEDIYKEWLHNHNTLAGQQTRELITDDKPIPVVSYRLGNIGNGPALNVKLTELKSAPITVDNLIGQGADQEVCFKMSLLSGEKNIFRDDKTFFTVEYEDVFKQNYKTTFAKQKNNFEEL